MSATRIQKRRAARGLKNAVRVDTRRIARGLVEGGHADATNARTRARAMLIIAHAVAFLIYQMGRLRRSR